MNSLTIANEKNLEAKMYSILSREQWGILILTTAIKYWQTEYQES